MHALLRRYKDGPAELRRRFQPRVAALLARFLQHHAGCIGTWDMITSVPSGRGRGGIHPLVHLIGMVPDLATLHRPVLRAGPSPLRHLAGSDQGFMVTSDVQDRQVLLIGDTFTSGAEVQSAASALQLAGAIVPAAVVIGRYIDPDFNEPSRALWHVAQARRFSFDRCCLCDTPWS